MKKNFPQYSIKKWLQISQFQNSFLSFYQSDVLDLTNYLKQHPQDPIHIFRGKNITNIISHIYKQPQISLSTLRSYKVGELMITKPQKICKTIINPKFFSNKRKNTLKTKQSKSKFSQQKIPQQQSQFYFAKKFKNVMFSQLFLITQNSQGLQIQQNNNLVQEKLFNHSQGKIPMFQTKFNRFQK